MFIGKQFIILIVIVDCMALSSSSGNNIEHFKNISAKKFDLKLVLTLDSLLGLEIHHNHDRIKACKKLR